MIRFRKQILGLISFALCTINLAAQEPVATRADNGVFKNDTLSLRIEFASGSADVKDDYEGNGERLASFREALAKSMAAEGAFMSGVFIRTVASPDGNTSANIALSSKRAENVRTLLCNEFGLSPFIVHVTSDGEDWGGLAELVSQLSLDEAPWRDEALEIINQEPRWKIRGQDVEDLRKVQLRSLQGGAPWAYLKKNVFPMLRSAYGDAMFVVSVPIQEKNEEPVVVVETQRDTVLVEKIVTVEYDGRLDRKFASRVEGKKFLLALRTNIFAIPAINVGAEFPFGQHWSVGVDFYYPWIKRNSLHKDCFEFVAYDMDVRYYLGSDRYPKESRLLGHSFGIYGAGGHYDFEQDWMGYQGTFFNIGFDWKYSWPVMHGKMHMEIEIGLGVIYSDAQPYDCFVPYGDCFRRPEERKIIRWYGPTRAQFNIVVPFYRKPIQSRRIGQ